MAKAIISLVVEYNDTLTYPEEIVRMINATNGLFKVKMADCEVLKEGESFNKKKGEWMFANE